MNKDLTLQIEKLKGELDKLAKENALLKKGLFSATEHTVKTPSNIQPIFDKAEKIVGDYFQQLQLKPSKGTIEIDDERYVLVRASALSNEFLKPSPTFTRTEAKKRRRQLAETFYLILVMF